MAAEQPEDSAVPAETLDSRQRRALYRAHHRGTKEMDILLGSFAEARLSGMNPAELEQFEELLARPDPELQRRILAPAADAKAAVDGPDADALDGLILALRRFHGLSPAT